MQSKEYVLAHCDLLNGSTKSTDQKTAFASMLHLLKKINWREEATIEPSPKQARSVHLRTGAAVHLQAEKLDYAFDDTAVSLLVLQY